MPPVMNDSCLIREIKDGNIQLDSDLMRRYQRRIMAFILHMLRSTKMEPIAEDLCSETFYKAFRSINSFREVDAQFSTWLRTTARNTVLSELRKQRSIQYFTGGERTDAGCSGGSRSRAAAAPGESAWSL